MATGPGYGSKSRRRARSGGFIDLPSLERFLSLAWGATRSFLLMRRVTRRLRHAGCIRRAGAQWRQSERQRGPKPPSRHLASVADDFIAAKGFEWRNEKHRAQWVMTLTKYAAPLSERPVDEIDTEAILEVLTPLWQKTPETASRLRGRIEAVLDAARARGFIPRNEANPLDGAAISTNSCRSGQGSLVVIMRRSRIQKFRYSPLACGSGKRSPRWPSNLRS